MLRFAWKFSGQSRPSPEVVVFNQSVRSGPTETCLSISKNYPFQSFFAKKKSKIRSKRKWIASIRLETLFQSNNVVPFSLDNFTGFWLVRHGKQPSFRLHFLYLVYQCRWGQPCHFLHPPRFPGYGNGTGYACLSFVFYAKYALFTPTSLAKPSLPKWWLVKENWRTGFHTIT